MTSRNRLNLAGTRTTRASSRPVGSSRAGRTASRRSAQTISYRRHHHEAPHAYASAGEAYAAPAYPGGGAAPGANAAKNSAHQYSRTNAQYYRKSEGASRGKKIMVGIVCALALTLVGSGTAFALYMNDINKRLVGGKSEDELRALADVLVPVTDYTEPFYLLLLGSDAREDEDEGGARTDTNILVRVDASTATVTLISIMRDTMINMGNYGTIKFNAAYAYEGTAGAVREASKLCGVNIAHYAEIEFEEFMTLVDALGGVEVDVPQRIADVEAGPVVLEPGVQTLDGVGALTLARSRKAFDDGDFSRTANQRLIIEAIVSKVLTMPLVDMIGAIEAATTSITTDMKLEEIISLARQFRTSGGTTIYSAVVPSALAMIDGISYVVADTEALKEMMRLVKAGKDPSGIVSTMVHPSMDPSTGDSSYYEEPLYGEPVYEPPPEEEDQPYEELPPVAGGEEPDPIGNEGDGTAAAP